MLGPSAPIEAALAPLPHALLVVGLLPTTLALAAPLAAVAALAVELLCGRLALAVLVVLGIALLFPALFTRAFLPLP